MNIGSVLSREICVTSGVTQGSNLEAILFLLLLMIYIEDCNAVHDDFKNLDQCAKSILYRWIYLSVKLCDIKSLKGPYTYLYFINNIPLEIAKVFNHSAITILLMEISNWKLLKY